MATTPATTSRSEQATTGEVRSSSDQTGSQQLPKIIGRDDLRWFHPTPHLQCQGVPEADSPGLAQTLEPLLSIEEAAGVLAISPRGLYRLIGRSDLVAVKVGGCTRIEPQELRRFIAERRKRPTEETDND